MKQKFIGLAMALVVMFVATGAVWVSEKPSTTEDVAERIIFVVKKIGSKWYVVDKNDRRKPIEAKRKDVIVWTARGSNMIFQFPIELKKYFVKENGRELDDNYVIRVKKGEKLRLKVKDNAPIGEIVYAVYVKKDDTFAEGTSPPVIIIKR